MNLKSRKMIRIETYLGWTQDEIMDAMQMLHDRSFAELHSDTPQHSVLWDTKIQEMCFKYNFFVNVITCPR